ncbi:MAG: hypothetical protein NZ656_03930 [Nitrospinaceae bacterium]|nr:hypothetical protein [Nitrospinaceae bacterium]
MTQTIRDWFQEPVPTLEQDKNLSPELLQRIKAIQVKTNYLVNDIMAGEYVSAF